MFRVITLTIFSFLFITNIFSQETTEELSSYEDGVIHSETESYEIIVKLGEGAFGKVFKVKNSKGEMFALKSYKFTDYGDDGAFSYYEDSEREYLRGQILDHPNIIKSIDFFSFYTSDNQFINNLVLQLVNGKTLSKTDTGSISKKKAVNASIQFCDAVRYALTLDLLHLDLHGGNVMLTNKSQTKIIDLASFFTYDEIRSFVRDSSTRTDSSRLYNFYGLAEGLVINQPDASSKTIKGAEKINKFFKNNPQLLEQLQDIEKNQQPAIDNWFNFNAGLNQKNKRVVDMNEEFKQAFNSYYFSAVSYICEEILSKSNLRAGELKKIHRKIQKLESDYSDRVKEHKNVFIFDYLDQLEDAIRAL